MEFRWKYYSGWDCTIAANTVFTYVVLLIPQRLLFLSSYEGYVIFGIF